VTVPSPPAPRGTARAARLEAATAAVAARLASVLPALGEQEASAALAEAVPVPARGDWKLLEELDAHLAGHPGALASGSSLCPPAMLRLAAVLHQAGHPVVRPGCAYCGVIRVDLRQLRAGGRVCSSCDSRSRLAACARCHRGGQQTAARRPEGPICHACYRKDPATFEECAGCGQLRHPVARQDDGRGLCLKCWKRPLHACASCGKTAPASLVKDDGAYCRPCYKRQHQPQRPCGRCGRPGRIARNAHDGQPDLCEACYQGPEMTCSGCGRLRPCNRNPDGQPACGNCHRRSLPGEPCARCGQTKRITTRRWSLGPVCDSCYNAVLRSPPECSRCGTVQPLTGRGDDGSGICGPCASHGPDYTCSQCGRHGSPYSRGRCAHCVLAERVTRLLAGPDGTVPGQLEPLAAALAAAPSPFGAIQWIKESPNTRLLAQIAAEGVPVSHELLDELPPDRNQRYIRQLLVHTGILDERNEDIERIPGWLEHQLAGKPAAHASLLRPFLHWFLLRRARQRAAARPYPASSDRSLRRRLSVALEFLAWADDRSLSLADLTQDHIDDWITGTGTLRRYQVRSFLNWTAGRRLTRKLTVPSIPRQDPQDLLEDDGHWQLLQRCLTDGSMPSDVRAAGAITLLFGPSAERLSHLTPDHLDFGGEHDYLTLGSHPVLLPPLLAGLLRHLAEQPEPRPQMSRNNPGPRWLFPGMVPGKPMSAHAMTQKLGRHGISVRAARNTAIAALAADLPTAILADLTGMHRHTALRWADYARRDWADYLAARAADLPPADEPGGTP
jgi:hypothetical protein